MPFLWPQAKDGPQADPKHGIDPASYKHSSQSLYRVPDIAGFWSALWKNIGLKGVSIVWKAGHSHDDNEHPKPILQGELIELLVAASLAQVVLDVFRREALFGRDGVPLGLIGSHLQFSDLGYFWSPEFWSGMKGFTSRQKQIFLWLLLVICGIIAVAIGPASALLLVPIQRDIWPAGSANLWLAGNQDYLWPTTLDNTTIDDTCRDASIDLQQTQLVSTSGCAWNGFQSFLGFYRASHQVQLNNVTFTDGMVTRILQSFVDEVPYPYSLAPNLAAASPSYELTQKWAETISNISGTSSEAHFKRHGAGTIVRIGGFIPTVRVSCNMYGNFTFPGNGTVQYPHLPASGAPSDASYNLPEPEIVDSEYVATVWRALPNGPSPLTNGSFTDYYPSAFLDLQIPHDKKFTPFGWYYTCSVDARWIRKDTVGAQFDDKVFGKYYVYGENDIVNTDRFPYASESLPANGAVKMTTDWLNNLTPAADDKNVGGTTLASLFGAARLDSPNTDQLPKKGYTESIIANVVADGMSRVGYTLNGGNLTLSDFHVQFLDDNSHSNYDLDTFDFRPMIFDDGGAQLPLPKGYSRENSTQVRWTVSIAGYSYKADSVAYWLSLIVLFVHSLIALAHTVWMVIQRQSSGAWHSLTELLVLSQNSEPAVELKNTCGGIDRGNTFSRTARIRAMRSKEAAIVASGREQVQMLFAEARQRIATERVEVNAAYGTN
ncbi:MAG: hypothetical protein Q9159_003262 [Coniocarpon cinnabarinum]